MNKSGNLSIREILVVTSAYARLPVRPYRLWGRWGGDARQPDRGTGNRVVHAFGQPAFFLAGNRMTIVACEEDAYLAKQLFASTEVLTWGKTPNIYEWKEKFKRILEWWKAKRSSYESCLCFLPGGELVLF